MKESTKVAVTKRVANVVYALVLVVSIIVCAEIGYVTGEVVAIENNRDATTKAHIEEYQHGYVYCPYCGEKLKEVE